MAFKPVFKFRNPDSTADLNSAYSSAIAKGIYSGGDVTVSGLNITVAPFTAVGFDGLVVKSDSTTVLTAVNGRVNVVALFARYEREAAPVIQLTIFDETTITSSALKDFYVIFGRVDLSAGGYTGLLLESSTPPGVGIGVYSFDTSHYADKVGVGLKQPSASFAALPYTKNRAGDVRYSLADQSIYAWNVGTKTWNNILATTAANVTYAGGNAWADGNLNPATSVEGQLDKILTDLGLGGGGASKISTTVFAGSPLDIGAGKTVQEMLEILVVGVNSRGLLAESNIWSGTLNTYEAGGVGPARTLQVNSEFVNIGNVGGTSDVTFRGDSLFANTSGGTLVSNVPTTVTSTFTSTGGATFSNTVSMSTLNVSSLTASGVARFTGGANIQEVAITPPTITADQTAYLPAGFQDAALVKIASDATVRTIHGLAYTSATHHRKTFTNVGATSILFKNESGSDPTLANRILTSDGFDFTLTPGASIVLLYDVGAARWRVLDRPNSENIISVALTDNQTAWNPTGWSLASVVRVNPDVDGRIISGLNNSVGVIRKLLINYDGTNSITIQHSSTDNGTSILCPNDGNFILGPRSTVELYFDKSSGASGYWRLSSASISYVFRPGIPDMSSGMTGITAFGAGDGYGVVAYGGTTEGIGIFGQGQGSGSGGEFVGGASGIGLTAGGGGLYAVDTVAGTTSGRGIEAYGAGGSAGIVSYGGYTNGNGIVGFGQGSGHGIRGEGGATNGIGVVGEGKGTGAGGSFTCGGTNGIGIVSIGSGTGAGGEFTAGASATRSILALGNGATAPISPTPVIGTAIVARASGNGSGIVSIGSGTGAGGYLEGGIGVGSPSGPGLSSKGGNDVGFGAGAGGFFEGGTGGGYGILAQSGSAGVGVVGIGISGGSGGSFTGNAAGTGVAIARAKGIGLTIDDGNPGVPGDVKAHIHLEQMTNGPSSVSNGDIWFAGTNLYIRIDDTTYTLDKTEV